MWKIVTAVLGVVVVILIVALVLFQGNSLNKIKSLENENNKLVNEHESKIKGLKDENTRLTQSLGEEKGKIIQQYESKVKDVQEENIKLANLLNDPTKRIPNLMERTKVLAKETINFYQEKDSQLLTKLSAIKEDYNKGRNDPVIFINVKKCLEAKENFRGSTEEYKEFAKSYLEFLADKQPELTASGIEIDSIKTNIQKNLGNNADNLSGMEKEMALIQEADIQVHADKKWQPAGITVNIDDTVYVLAKRDWSIRTGGPKLDADGEAQASPPYAEEGFESVKLGALICKIAGDSDYILKKEGQYGKKFSFVVQVKTGQLYFTVNDNDRTNNHGALNVKVIVVKKQ